MAWLAGYSTQFEIGPISEATIGNLVNETRQTLACDADNAHTQIMSLKNAALLALLGTLLLTILLLLNLLNNILAFMRGVISPMVLLSSLIYAFAALSVAVFFYVFHRAQS